MIYKILSFKNCVIAAIIFGIWFYFFSINYEKTEAKASVQRQTEEQKLQGVLTTAMHLFKAEAMKHYGEDERWSVYQQVIMYDEKPNYCKFLFTGFCEEKQLIAVVEFENPNKIDLDSITEIARGEPEKTLASVVGEPLNYTTTSELIKKGRADGSAHMINMWFTTDTIPTVTEDSNHPAPKVDMEKLTSQRSAIKDMKDSSEVTIKAVGYGLDAIASLF